MPVSNRDNLWISLCNSAAVISHKQKTRDIEILKIRATSPQDRQSLVLRAPEVTHLPQMSFEFGDIFAGP